jgi:RimJ/RimL family protein N-acetyltransferase
VRLREWRDSDLPEIVAACRDSDIARWTLVPDHYDVHEGRAFLTRSRQQAMQGTVISLAVVRCEDDSLAGSISLDLVHGGPRGAEIGYWVAAPARGAGIASRAIELLSTWALEQLALERVQILVEPENLASWHAAERAGFRRERLLPAYRELKGRRRDYYAYSRER